MKKINLAFRGGAFPGKNAYVPFEFELEKKIADWRIGIAAGSSVGGLEIGMIGCGFFCEKGAEALREVRFDDVMAQVAKLETKKTPGPLKILLAPIAFFRCKRQLSPEFHAVLRRRMSWNLFKSVGIIGRAYIGIADQRSWGFITGADRVSGFRDMFRLLEAKKGGDYSEYLEKIPMYWGSHDGWYSWTVKKGFHKISDTVSPLGDLVYGTFNNPALERIEFEINVGGRKTKKIKAFDGGIVNNHSNLVFHGRRGVGWHQIACEPEPAGRLGSFSDFMYNMCRAKKGHYHYLPPTEKGLGFFEFTDQRIDQAYSRKRKPSRILI